MVTAGFILRRPSESSLGIHIACYAPGNDEAAVFLDDFRQSHAIVGAMVQLGTYAVLGVVSIFVLPCYGTIWYTMAALSIAEIAVIASSHVRYVQDSRGPYCILLNFPRMLMYDLSTLLHRVEWLVCVVTAAVLSILTAPQSLSTVFIAYPFGLVLFCSFVKFVLHTRASFDVYWYFLLVLCTVQILPSMLWLAVTDASIPAAVVLLSISADILDGWTLAAIMLTLRRAVTSVVAQGSTSVVLRGRLQHALREPEAVAIKLYTTWFVTDDEVRLFSKEAACNAQLSHPNIVRFYGLCVVPPSICLVFEFCDLGSLESILQAQRRTGDAWDLRTKLKACLDACRAAPEMINGSNTKSAVYGPAADVYSLTMTLWHILVPGEAPWHGHSHFDVYTEIIQGHRPRLPSDLPPGCVDLLERGWSPQPHDREPIHAMVQRVLDLYTPFTQ
ncbi:hypothetical protein DYB32_005082 [Aphanomyces invadans]|uniref:Protein kinase domain-containing protein n=1 Tax=Aphanomyces invadans TaxID=157072 RepID=A0A3R6Z3X4_9STRA|nr:hypothetical protein DYB32_005082 [Aphanomyces invadans]